MSRILTYGSLLASLERRGILNNRSLKVYRSTVKRSLSTLGLGLGSSVSMAHFRSLQEQGDGKVPSAVVRIYRQFVAESVCDDSSIEQIISRCLCGLVDREKLKKVGLESGDVKSVVYQTLNGEPDVTATLEEALFLPKGILESYSRRKDLPNIPEMWWPDDLKGKYNSAVKKQIRHMWLKDVQDCERTEDREEVFKEIIEKFDKGEIYGIGDHRRRGMVISGRRRNIPLSEAAAREFETYSEYKKKSIGKGGSRQWKSKGTIETNRGHVAAYYTYLIQSGIKDKLLPKKSELNLGFFASSDLVIKFCEHYASSIGVYNKYIEAFIKSVKSLLDARYGWLALNPKYMDMVPREIFKNSEGLGWEEICRLAKRELNDYLNDVVLPQMRATRDGKDRIEALLEKEFPLAAVFKGLDCSLEYLNSLDPTDKEFAYWAQYHVMVFLLSCFPMRAKNYAALNYGNNSRRKSRLEVREDGRVLIVAMTEDLKNGRTNRLLRSEEEIVVEIGRQDFMRPHVEFLKKYLKEYRPRINGGNKLFISKSGKNLTTTTLSSMMLIWTEKFLSSDSPYPSRIIGLPPFTAHAFRHIVATHFCKRGQEKVAALLLLDSLEMILKHLSR